MPELKQCLINGKDATKFITPNDVFKVSTLMEGLEWVHENIEYMPDEDRFNIPDYWQMPITTLHLETGDCEDMSLLLSSILHKSGFENRCVIGLWWGQEHMWVEAYCPLDGRWHVLDPVTCRMFPISERSNNGYVKRIYIYPEGCEYKTSLVPLAVLAGLGLGGLMLTMRRS